MKVTNDDAEIESLLRTGIYKDKETLFHDAIKALFITKPNLRYEIAIDRYRNKVISLWPESAPEGTNNSSELNPVKTAVAPAINCRRFI